MVDHVPEGRYGGNAARKERDEAGYAVIQVPLRVLHVVSEEKPAQVDKHRRGFASETIQRIICEQFFSLLNVKSHYNR